MKTIAALLPLPLIALAAPALAQDHSAHQPPAPAAQADMAEAETAPSAEGAMDHSTMDHSTMDHSTMDQSTMDQSTMDHSTMDHGSMDHAPAAADETPPPRAFSGPRHAADSVWGADAMRLSRKELGEANGGMTYGVLYIDRLEAALGETDSYVWDVEASYGGDLDRLVIRSEGEGPFDGEVESVDVQALWSHAIGPWFNLQTGVRYGIEPVSRAYGVIGVSGLAPYMIHTKAFAYLSDQGDLTGKVEAEYDQRITQKLVVQPRVEMKFSAQDVGDLGLGSGLTSIETGLRLRYELQRQFAPYVGVGYKTLAGGTADIARSRSEDTEGFSLLLGIRAWM